MKAKYTTILTISILITIGFVLGLSTLTGFFTLAEENPTEASEVLTNLSFEETRENTPIIPKNWFWNTEWNSEEKDTEQWDTNAIFLDKEMTHNGKKSLTHNTKSVGQYAIISKVFNIKAGKTYRVEFFAKTNATLDNGLPEVSWLIFDSEGNDLTSAQEGILFNSTDVWEVDFPFCPNCGGGDTFNIQKSKDEEWMKISFDFKPYGDAEKATIVLGEFGEGIVWSWWSMSDFSIKEIKNE